MRRWFLITIPLTALALALIAALWLQKPYTFHGSLIDPATPAPDFSLADGQGGQFHLAAQRGQVVLVFFGFTNCMDVCPTTLANMEQIRQRLGNAAGQVRFVFITVDPERDTPAKTAAYARGFDPTFFGLSGTEQQLEPVWQAYGVYRQLDKTSTSDTAYNVEHSSQTYLIDASGNLRLTYAYGTAVDDMLQDIRHLVK